MKHKIFLLASVILLGGAGVVWMVKNHSPAPVTAASDGGKILYYTCSMHPWIREHKPGPCPVCGMTLTPVYENAGGATGETNPASLEPGAVTLEPESISTINVRTALVERRSLSRTLHLAGQIIQRSTTAAWFEFTIYERDLPWLQIDQKIAVRMPSAPDIVYAAQINLHSTKPFADADFDRMTDSTTMRAELLDLPVQPGNFGKYKLFNGLHAEGHLVSQTPPVLAVPRSAILSRGIGPMVYVDKGDGHYAPRAVLLGRTGDEFSEVLAGLKEGEKVVTTGNLLIDSEAQLTAGQ